MRIRPFASRFVQRSAATLGSVALLVIGCGQSPTDAGGLELDPADLNILFVGNSLTYFNNLPGMLHAMIDSAGAGTAVIASSAFPNAGLEDHWNASSTRDLLARPGWDFVILQQGPSATEGRPSLLEYGQAFAEEAREGGATPAFYMVWPSNARFFDFDGVSESYRMAAEASSALLFPAGEAWRVAWETDPDLPLYGPDQFHPSAEGSYVAALVMFEQITGLDPAVLPRIFETSEGLVRIGDQVADILVPAASEANRRYAVQPSAQIR